MLDHPIVDVALGLILLYTVLSLRRFDCQGVDLDALLVSGEEPGEGDSDTHRHRLRLPAVRASAGEHAGDGEEAPVLTSDRAPSRRRSWTCSRTTRMASLLRAWMFLRA